MSEPKTCGISLHDHIENISLAMMDAGIGAGCFTTYQALVEIAESQRVALGFPVYKPVLTEQLTTEVAERKAQELTLGEVLDRIRAMRDATGNIDTDYDDLGLEDFDGNLLNFPNGRVQ